MRVRSCVKILYCMCVCVHLCVSVFVRLLPVGGPLWSAAGQCVEDCCNCRLLGLFFSGGITAVVAKRLCNCSWTDYRSPVETEVSWSASRSPPATAFPQAPARHRHTHVRSQSFTVQMRMNVHRCSTLPHISLFVSPVSHSEQQRAF